MPEYVRQELQDIQSIGLAGGNIKESGTMPMCSRYCNNLAEILDYIEEEE